MSNAASALNNRVANGTVTVREMGLRGMITLRGDLSDASLKKACKSLTGQDFPAMGKANVDGEKGLCWMSPDEVLILVPHAQAAEAVTQIEKAMKGKHHLAVNVSDARALLSVEGPYAREVIAKLAPVDLHPDTFKPGDFRRSRLGQVAAAFWMADATTAHVICFRSIADYAFRLLATSAKAGPVGIF
ncbi:sarcosine oxidase subunit gamma [Yoonia sp. 208BN28-4]|uniref:sarcosine oxidase subunit gamma n=1 Tax=Yoonia sp. 208BN28-4 TaxID=3126505 RepID=UPI0030A22DDD